MILELKYIQVRHKSGAIEWKSLVTCEYPRHRGKHMRTIFIGRARKGIGVRYCHTCSGMSRHGIHHPNWGTHHTEEQKKIWSLKYSGKNAPMFGKHHTLEARQKIRETHTGEKNCWFGVTGPAHPTWNPDITDEERKKGRFFNTVGYNNWRNNVFKRDEYVCQVTGDANNSRLNAHHLYNYAQYPEKRLDINNGITMREDIHDLFHMIYGKKYNTPEQFGEFKKYMQEVLAEELSEVR